MPPRSSWKGFIKLSLVSVPVKAYTATASGNEVRLNQLHDECNSRVQYRKVCPTHGEIANDEIVSGYEYSKGQYVKVDPGEIQKIRKQSDKSIHIDGFIPPDQVDPLYYAGRTYYLAPDGAVGQKPYALLRETMLQEGVFGVARAIISSREHVVLLRPIDNLITMQLLQYSSKVKSMSSMDDEIVDTEFSQAELDLTKTLIDASRIEEFDFAEYKDEYTTQLTELIEMKVAGQEIVAAPDPEEPKIVNLMEALKESVARAQDSAPARSGAKAAKKTTKKAAKKTTKKASAKKMAPSAATRTPAKRKKKSG